MKLGNETEYLELVEEERMPKGTPTVADVRIKVTLKLQEFYGSYSNIWLEKPEIERFIEELKTVVEQRQGSVKLGEKGDRLLFSSDEHNLWY